MKEQKGVED